MRGALLVLARQWEALDAAERALERQIKQAAAADRDARRLMEVPSVGPIIASAVLAKVADARVFRTGRDFAAWIGLTGRDHGTGGKPRPGPISKQGDRMLRTLLINGASAHLRQARRHGVKDPWLRALLARRPYKVAMVALRRQDRPHHLGHAGHRTKLSRSRERAGPSLRAKAGPLALTHRKGQLWC